jgi:hypothetical protein
MSYLWLCFPRWSGLNDQGAIVSREKIARARIAARLAKVPRC